MYRLAISYEFADVPIETLTLPKVIVTSLRKAGISRVCDLLGRELDTIDGIGRSRAEILRNRLRIFFSYDI